MAIGRTINIIAGFLLVVMGFALAFHPWWQVKVIGGFLILVGIYPTHHENEYNPSGLL